MGLDVYMHGRLVGSLARDGGRGYTFTYAPGVVREVGEGETLLSGSMPVRAQPYGHEEARHYIEGLLPEGARREAIEVELGLAPGDDFGLIAELGRDCPGAVVFMPEGEAPPAPGSGPSYWLTDAELEELLSRPAAFLEDGEADARFTLPGWRHKLALIHDEAGDRWALPGPGAPSTHIVKPETGEMPAFAINEIACTAAVGHMGLPVTHVAPDLIAGIPCVVSKRFDRWGEGAAVERLHSESFHQALSNSADRSKGEAGAVFRALELLRSLDGDGGVETLFKVAYCNYMLGNGDDTHATNAALVYTEAGRMLAPFYDICSEHVYRPDDEIDPDLSTADELVRLSPLAAMLRLGVPSRLGLKGSMILAIETHLSLAKSLNVVAEQALREGWHVPLIEEILLRVMQRFKMLGAEFQGLRDYDGPIPWIEWRP